MSGTPISAEVLQRFCNPELEDPRGMTHTPFSDDQYTYATNGHILVRAPKLDQFEKNESFLDWASKALEGFKRTPEKWLKVLPTTHSKETCKVCDGSGRLQECAECDGSGDVEFSTDYNDYEHECKSCRGEGVSKTGSFGTPDVVCDTCHGSGLVWGDAHRDKYGEAYFCASLISLMQDLPNIEIGPFEANDVALFRFNGGDGLIMPLRQ